MRGSLRRLFGRRQHAGRAGSDTEIFAGVQPGGALGLPDRPCDQRKRDEDDHHANGAVAAVLGKLMDRLAVVVVGDRATIEAPIRATNLGPVTIVPVDDVMR